MTRLPKSLEVRTFSGEAPGGKRPLYKGERCINSVSLLGRVGSDAEQRGSVDRPVVTFSLATSEKFISPTGETSEAVQWHRIAVFRPGLRDAVLAIAKKGNRLYLTGTLKYSLYEASSGVTQRGINIIASDVILVGVKQVDESEWTEDQEEQR